MTKFTKNFSDKTLLIGETTSFYRIQKLDKTDTWDYWILPELISGDSDQILINGIKYNEWVEGIKVLDNDTGNERYNIFGPNQTESLWNTYGGNSYIKDTRVIENTIGIKNISWLNTDNVSTLIPDSSEPTDDDISSKEILIRVDYYGVSECLLRLNVIIVNKNTYKDELIANLPIIDNYGVPNSLIGYSVVDSPIDKIRWEYIITDSPELIKITFTPEKYFPTLEELHKNDILLGNHGEPELYIIKSNIICKPIEKNKFSREIGDFLDKPIIDLEKDRSSHLLLQSNPKLSGNIKLVIDSEENLFLETMDATSELAQDKYKKKPVNQFTDYPSDIKKYFGDINSELLFTIYNKNSDYTTTKFSFFEQYDNFYSYGTSQLDSKYYDEELSLFAPLWLKRDIPEFFVIFKTPGPLNKGTYNKQLNNDDIKEIISNSYIIKTFDLRRGSELGNYLRKITEDERFKESPLRVVFNKDELTTWNGISYKEGIIVEKGEYLNDFYKEDQAINKFEEILTGGFQRNELVSTNLINLEFLFTDETSELFEINRYFGLYVNMIDITEWQIDLEQIINIDNQIPVPVIGRDLTDFAVQPFTQSNNNGIVLPVKNDISGLDNSLLHSGRILNVIDRDNNIFKIKGIDKQNISLYNKEIDINKFTGSTKISSQVWAKKLAPSFSQLEIEFVESEGKIILENEVFIIEENVPWGLKWICIANNNNLNPGKSWNFPYYNEFDNTWTNNFSVEGDVSNISKALTSCLSKFKEKTFTVFNKDNKIIIKNNSNLNLKFTRVFTKGSNFNTLGIFGNFPLSTFDEYSYIDNTINNKQITLSAKQITNFTEFSVKLERNLGNNSPLYENIGEWKLYKNGGLIHTFYKDLNNNFEYSYNNITINYEYTNGAPVEDTVWEFLPTTKTIEFDFVGNSEVTGNRVIIKKEDLDLIDPDAWFQYQKRNYSKLKRWEVFGNTIYNIDYLEEPVYNSAGELIDYKNLDKWVVLQLPENYKFIISNEEKITSFISYFPKIGILSISDIKIIDTDWLESDYSISPVTELFGVYDKLIIEPESTIDLNINQSYKVLEGEGRLEGQRLDNDEWELIELVFQDTYFNTYSMNWLFIDNIDISNSPINDWDNNILTTPNLYEKTYKNFRLSNTDDSANIEIIKNLYYENLDYRRFNGFLGISDFTDIDDERDFNNLLNTYNIDRFLLSEIKSEYDRLRENFNKNFALKSKVVPTICKWVSKDKDVRDNPYRLNNSLAFGINNFSPDPDIAEQNSQLHTHEFVYIDSIPKDFDPDFLPTTNHIFYNDISKKRWKFEGKDVSWYDLFKINTEIDYFTKYFTVGYPTEKHDNESVQLKTERKYSVTEFVSGANEVQCIFRGSRFSFDEYNDNGELIPGSRKWEGYKFSSILRFLPIPIERPIEPFNTEFIINERHKTILFIITIYINDYRLNTGEWGYTNLYSQKSNLRLRSTINRDDNWRYLEELNDIQLKNSIVDIENDSIITVFLKNKKKDIKLINHGIFNLSDYFSEFEDEDELEVKTVSFGNSKYSSLHQLYKFAPSKYLENISMDRGNNIDIFSDDKMSFKVSARNFTRTFKNLKKYDNIITSEANRITALDDNLYLGNTIDPEMWYMSGGELYLKDILYKISFSNIKFLMNDKSKNIKISYKYPKKIIKNSRLLPISDTDKPDAFTNINIIGFDLEKSDERETIYRYDGYFQPKMKNVIYFNIREDIQLANILGGDFIFSNTTMNLDKSNQSLILNKWFNKVGNNNLSKIGNTNKYNSVYPLINELNIDNKDYNIWSSNWDNDYYRLYNSMTKWNNISGINELKNSKSFFGSKNMKIPFSFSIDQFLENEYTFNIINNINNNIRSRNNNTNTIEISIFIDSIIRRYLIDNGATYEFQNLNDNGILEKVFGRTFNEEDIIQLTTRYLDTNIIKLYRVKEIIVRSRKSNTIDFIDNFTLEEKIEGGFIKTDTKINNNTDNIWVLENSVNIDNIKEFTATVYIERI